MAYRLALGEAEPEETAEGVSFLGRQTRSTGAAPHRADAAADHSGSRRLLPCAIKFKRVPLR